MSLINVNKKWCKKCKICIDLCPSNALTSDEEGYPATTFTPATRAASATA